MISLVSSTDGITDLCEQQKVRVEKFPHMIFGAPPNIDFSPEVVVSIHDSIKALELQAKQVFEELDKYKKKGTLYTNYDKVKTKFLQEKELE